MLETLIDNCNAQTKVINKFVGDIPPEKMTAQFPGLPNHPTWTIGHLTQVRAFILQWFDKSAGLPADWPTRFGRESVPVSDPTAYPSKEQILATFQRVHDQLMTVLRTVDEKTLDVPHDRERLLPLFPTKRHFLMNLLTMHEGMHLGQLGDFRRVLGLPRVL